MNRLLFVALCVFASFTAGTSECAPKLQNADGSCSGGADSSALLQSKLQYEEQEGDMSEEENLALEESDREAEEERNEKAHDENEQDQEEEDQAEEEQEPEEEDESEALPACSSFTKAGSCPKRCVFVEALNKCTATTPKILPCASFADSGACPKFCKWSKKLKQCQVRFKTCGQYKEANSCPFPCQFFDGKCKAPCTGFKDSGRCPSRCDWKASTCVQPGAGKGTNFAGPKKKKGPQPKGANKAMEAQYGTG
jgi:hypothetical protein